MALAGSEGLIERARRRTGLTDFGPEGWRGGLDRLLASLAETDFGEAANAKMEARLEGVLAIRLRIEDWIARHPQVLSETIEGPVAIIGLPRTATTAVHAFLANDPQWRYLRGWEANEPIPPPDIETEACDPRMLAEQASPNGGAQVSLNLHIHEAGAPVDDSFQPRLNFHQHEFSWPAWSYTRWWRDCDMTGTYAYHARLHKLLQSRRPPNRWLVKAPSHNFHLDALVGEYPDARFIMCHRDPVQVIPSVCSLLRSIHRDFFGAEIIAPEKIGAHVLEHMAISSQRVLDFRRRHGDDRFIDIGHRPFNADPFGTLDRIYDGLGLTLAPGVRPVMEAWRERNRRGAHGEHRYSAEEFGLSEGQIRDAFAPCLQRFEV